MVSWRDPDVHVYLLCGADLVESFAKPGVWSEEDMRRIFSTYQVACVERVDTNLKDVIFGHDILFQYRVSLTIFCNVFLVSVQWKAHLLPSIAFISFHNGSQTMLAQLKSGKPFHCCSGLWVLLLWVVQYFYAAAPKAFRCFSSRQANADLNLLGPVYAEDWVWTICCPVMWLSTYRNMACTPFKHDFISYFILFIFCLFTALSLSPPFPSSLSFSLQPTSIFVCLVCFVARATIHLSQLC